MIANDLHDHLVKTATWVDWERGVDGFKIGDSQAAVSGIAVAWIAIDSALRRAHELGCSLFVTHEDPFYADQRPDPDRYPQTAVARRFLEETGLVVYRCHDAWDVWPGIGILDSWASALGLEGEPVATDRYYAVYEVGPTSAAELAETVLERVGGIGEEAIRLSGDPDAPVSRLAIGTGAITDPFKMLELGADVLLCTDDPLRTTAHLGWCADMGVPVLIVNHATAEEPGIANLAVYLREQFPDAPVEHLRQGCMYRTIGGR
jgi:putative NIF3 family GTP cyclohydrolase 1 type 2